MYLNPWKMTPAERRRVDAWLVANGARWLASLDYAVIQRGRHIEYVSLCRRDPKSMRRLDWMRGVPCTDCPRGYHFEPLLKVRRVRCRVPLSAIPEVES